MQSILPGKIGITPSELQKDIDRIQQTLTSTVNLEKVVRGTELSLSVSSPRELLRRSTCCKKISRSWRNATTSSNSRPRRLTRVRSEERRVGKEGVRRCRSRW